MRRTVAFYQNHDNFTKFSVTAAAFWASKIKMFLEMLEPEYGYENRKPCFEEVIFFIQPIPENLVWHLVLLSVTFSQLWIVSEKHDKSFTVFYTCLEICHLYDLVWKILPPVIWFWESCHCMI